MNFTSEELQQITQRGSDPKQVEEQFSRFTNGFPFARLARPATVGDGIIRIPQEATDYYLNLYEQQKEAFTMQKFVPASGAASRMFKSLFELKDNPTPDEKQHQTGLKFLHNLPNFAFYETLQEVMQQHGHDLSKAIAAEDYHTIIHYLLDEEGLGYGHKPKGALLFHRYENGHPHTPIEEHLIEAAEYACNNDRHCPLHFTVSPQHQPLFEQIVAAVKDEYEEKYNVKYDITYSIQEPSTDTLAATMDNQPYRDASGKLLFRPGGHGALIHNLNQLDGDIIFIKNIDNVTTEDKLAPTIEYKKILAAYLMETVSRCHRYLHQYEHSGGHNPALETAIMVFARDWLHIPIERTEDIPALLNRPIRICGMVPNQGAPGGGPFWVEDDDGHASLQIVESSQIDHNNTQQQAIADSATHFNPVDLVCNIRDYHGNKFDLTRFVDPKTGFIALKTDGDRQLKAMELPGLWNGAMAHWITLFIEVPYTTFNPAKTVFDLLNR